MGYNTIFTISKLGNVPLKAATPSCEHKYDAGYEYCPHCGKPNNSNLDTQEAVEMWLKKLYPSYGNWSPFVDSCKWYEHESEMREISKKYPNVVFVLHGEGEEPGDIWNKFFKNGKMQECKARITFDKFDAKKLS